MSILDTILAAKRREVEQLRSLHATWEPPKARPWRRDFSAALRQGQIALIAEFKRSSPSRGDLAGGRGLTETVRSYERAGAAVVSVLTDRPFFAGQVEDVATARQAVRLPVLRKDFLIERCQLAQTAGSDGPDAVLLIAAALSPKELRSFREMAWQCGQAVLVEVHDEAELDCALETGAEIVGINNRDLRTFQVSLETTLRLRPRIPAGITVVAESGINTRDDVLRLVDAGVHAMLVGEALMKAQHIGRKIAELLER